MEYRGGIYLPELDLWLDPHGAKDRAFVSHAHFDHYAAHGKLLCSEQTGALANQRFRVAKARIESRPLRQPWEESGFEICLLPAGHIFGSAMIHLTRVSDGATLLYTGDFKIRQGLTAEAAEFLPADIFITETTFGEEKYVFPPEEVIQETVLNFVKSALEDSEVPVLFGYSLGKAQEVISLMDRHGIPSVQHKSVASMSEACRKAGLSLSEPMIFEKEVPPGHALVCPPNAVRSRALRNLKNKRTAMLTGWALNPGARYRYQTDEVIPLSDHADFPGLLKAVDEVRPKRVLTLHGSAREFASVLRSRGIEAWSVFGNDQLELGLAEAGGRSSGSEKVRPECGLQRFSDVLKEAEKTSGRLQKIEVLSAYLSSLADEDLAMTTNWLEGRVFGRSEGKRRLSVGSSLIRQALLEATGLPLARYKEVSATQNDSARTARLLLSESDLEPRAWSLRDLSGLFDKLVEASGSLSKVKELASALQSLHPKEGESVVRILTGGMRTGVKEGLLEEAVAKAFELEAKEIREAHMLAGDLGQVAMAARRRKLKDIRFSPLVPVKVMLASPEENAEGIADRLGFPVWLEAKYDGIRAQLHKSGRDVALFSRDLRVLDGEFPELLEEASLLDQDFVLDGEVIAYAEGRRLTFFDLQKRLGRKKAQGDLFLGAAIPVKFVAFDLLFAKGRDLLGEPLERRRRELERLNLSGMVEVIEVMKGESVEEIESAFKAAKVAGNEGLIAKDPRSAYLPGRRGKSWLKLKKAMPTLDCVVIKAQQGHGKRSGVLSDYTFAVKDETSGQLLTIGKAYSGLSDQEIEDLTEFFQEHTLEKSRRVHVVEPMVVLEIAFDSIHRSKRHDSGLALRFPRIKAIRLDKSPDEIDTLVYAESLVGAVTF